VPVSDFMRVSEKVGIGQIGGFKSGNLVNN
jgi:hypothetical protein